MRQFDSDEIKVDYSRLKGDTNIAIRLKSGELLKVIYPLRIACEYETPWLTESQGSRGWGSNVQKWLDEAANKQLGRNPRFIVAIVDDDHPMTGYLDSRGVIRTIPFFDVSTVEALPEQDVAIGKANWKQERINAARKAFDNPNQPLTRGEFIELVRALRSKGIDI